MIIHIPSKNFISLHFTSLQFNPRFSLPSTFGRFVTTLQKNNSQNVARKSGPATVLAAASTGTWRNAQFSN
jgi:hypothetical protein